LHYPRQHWKARKMPPKVRQRLGNQQIKMYLLIGYVLGKNDWFRRFVGFTLHRVHAFLSSITRTSRQRRLPIASTGILSTNRHRRGSAAASWLKARSRRIARSNRNFPSRVRACLPSLDSVTTAPRYDPSGGMVVTAASSTQGSCAIA